MAKEKTTGQKIKEWLKHSLVISCFSGQNEEQAIFIPPLVRQGGMLNLFQSKEDRLDEVNSRDSLVDGIEVSVIGGITDHAEPASSS